MFVDLDLPGFEHIPSAPQTKAQRSNAAAMREARESQRDVGRHTPAASDLWLDKWEMGVDLLRFLKLFFPKVFFKPFCPAHVRYIKALEAAILFGGHVCAALPRGYGKTSIIMGSIIWAMCYGHRRYTAVIANTAKAASSLIDSIKTNIEHNPELLKFFPELCYYAKMLGGQRQRAAGQLSDGEQTGIVWRNDFLALATVAEDPDTPLEYGFAGAVEARGLTSGIRGMLYATATGEERRPDLALLDDPQTTESAKSLAQTEAREQIVLQDVLGLAGGHVAITAVMTCTVIADNDLSCRFLERWKSGDGLCVPLVEQWPDDPKAFDRYREIVEDLRATTPDPVARRAALNAAWSADPALSAGGRVSNEEYKPEGVISALQAAFERRIDVGDAAFAAEFQNEVYHVANELYVLDPAKIATHTTARRWRELDPAAPFRFAAVDVNYYALSYVVGEVMNDFTVRLTDYGWWTGGRECIYSHDMAETEDQAVFAALAKFVPELIASVGKPLSAIGIDGNRFTEPVYRYVKSMLGKSPCYLLPLRGVAAQSYREPSPHDKRLQGKPRTRCCRRQGREDLYSGWFDSYFWHKKAQEKFLLPPDAPGGISLFSGHKPHRVFAEQFCADVLTDFYERNGELKYSWKLSPGAHNEMSDCVAMLCALANLAGVEVAGGGPVLPQQRPRMQRRIIRPNDRAY